MKKTAKRILMSMSSVVILFAMGMSMAGCRVEDYLPEYENEYFRYAVRTNKDGTQEGYLIGFTELGAEQTALILPQEINGVPMVGFGYERQLGWGEEKIGEFISENLKKLYIPFVASKGFKDLPKAESTCKGGYVVKWKNAFVESFPFGSDIVGFNILEDFINETMYNNYNRLANLSYMYNYEGAEDGGYYWVDSYDNGLVEFIPPEPTREGYRFGGWYKEPECITLWDFATDKTGDEIVIEAYSTFEQYENSEITYLYAKWMKE